MKSTIAVFMKLTGQPIILALVMFLQTSLGTAESNVAGSAQLTSAQTPPTPSKELQQAVWQKLVVLISAHDGYVTPGDFGRAFGIKLKKNVVEPYNQDKAIKFSNIVEPSAQWPFKAILEVYEVSNGLGNALLTKPWSGVKVFFRDVAAPREQATSCLEAAPILNDLGKHGWTVDRSFAPVNTKMHDEIEASASNAKGAYVYVAKVRFDSNRCINSIRVEAAYEIKQTK